MFTHDLGGGAELRILEQSQAPAFLSLIEANRAFLGQWLDWATTITTIEDARQFIQRGMNRFAEDDLPWCSIWLDRRMVGGTLFFPLDRRLRSTLIGYWLAQDATGHGLMTRSCRALLGFAFDDLKLNRIGLEAEVANLPSRKVAERLGFTFEGVRRDGWARLDRFVDMAVYAMLARDWQTAADDR
jgi:ribosomal-protein-serine acetyltransferase